MKTLTFLLSTVIELCTMVVLLRVWMQWARCDFITRFRSSWSRLRSLSLSRCAVLSRRWGRSTAPPCWSHLFSAS